MAKSRLNNMGEPLSVGDMVARTLYYSNGKPKQKKDYDYTVEEIGLVIAERIHTAFKEPVLIVKFGNKEAHYIKSTSGSFLTKMS